MCLMLDQSFGGIRHIFVTFLVLSIYRLFHLIITLGFQILIMRDMEKLTGAIRMAIIYIGTGMAGNLASCIFVPYQVEVS